MDPKQRRQNKTKQKPTVTAKLRQGRTMSSGSPHWMTQPARAIRSAEDPAGLLTPQKRGGLYI